MFLTRVCMIFFFFGRSLTRGAKMLTQPPQAGTGWQVAINHRTSTGTSSHGSPTCKADAQAKVDVVTLKKQNWLFIFRRCANRGSNTRPSVPGEHIQRFEPDFRVARDWDSHDLRAVVVETNGRRVAAR